MIGRDLTFRVFISSTFSDLAAERNALQERVFPRLREYCTSFGARFQPIDLRWGVSEEAARDQQTIALCLQEIERCRQSTPRPNFIALIGDRHGWRPLPRTLAIDGFDRVLGSASPDEAALLRRWYREDGNAVPRAFTLLSRFEMEETGDDWADVEERIRTALERGLGRLPSATEQEIRAGILDPHGDTEHAFTFIRRIENLPDTPAASLYRDLTPSGQPDLAARSQLADLEARLRARLGPSVFEYRAEWTGNAPSPVSGAHLDALCADVYERLRRVIAAELERHRARDPFALECEPHERIVRRYEHEPTGRGAQCGTVRDWLDDASVKAIVVHGPWGSGKTAFMAHVAACTARAAPQTVLVARFIGEAPSTTALRTLLESLVRQAARLLGEHEGEASTLDELVVRLRDKLDRLARSRRVVLLIDGLDLMAPGDSARTFHWLPADVPAGVTLLLSCSSGEPVETLCRRLPGARPLELGPISLDSAREVISTSLRRAARDLAPSQWRAVEDALGANRLPLYISLVAGEACGWRSFDQPPRLPATVADLVRRHMASLAEGRRHGRVFPERCLAFLAASKDGLSEDELLSILSEDAEVMTDFKLRNPRAPDVPALPFIVWSRLRADLDRFLHARVAAGATVLSFRDREVESLLRRTLSASTDCHAALARHFTNARGEGKGPHPRALAELPYQQLRAGNWEGLDATLTDVTFLEEKLAVGLGVDLLADFERLGEADAGGRLERCRLLGRAFANVFDFVRNAPETVGPQVHLELQAGDMESSKDLFFRLEDGCAPRVWLLRYKHTTNERAWHEAQTAFDREYVHFARFSPDGQAVLFADLEGRLTRWHWPTGTRTDTSVPAPVGARGVFRSGTLLTRAAFAIASNESVWILGIDDIWTGDLRRGVWTRRLTAAAGESFERLGSDGQSGQGILAVRDQSGPWLWDVTSDGAVVARRRMPVLVPNQSVNHVAVAAGGRPRAVCFDSGHLVISSGLTVRAHAGGALHCEFVEPDEHVATCGRDGTLALWDPARGLASRVELMPGAAECLACAPTGRRIAVGHRDGQVSLVERNQSISVRCFSPGIAGWVLTLAFSPCGRYLATAGRRGGLRIFDLDNLAQKDLSVVMRLPTGAAVAASHVTDAGACLFEDGDRRLFSTSACVDTAQLPVRIQTHCLDPARNAVLAVTYDRLRALDPETGAVVYEQEIPGQPRYAASMTPDGATLALLERDGVTMMSWVAETHRWVLERTLPVPGEVTGSWRLGVPFLISADGLRLFLPMEPNVSGESNGDTCTVPSLRRHLAVLDAQTGEQRLAIPYSGFCTGLAEWRAHDALIAGFGDGPVFFDDSFIWCRDETGIRVYSLRTGMLLQPRDTLGRDARVAGLAIDPAEQMVAFTTRDGRVFLQPLSGGAWSASVRLPTGALAPRFDARGRILWVPDDGRGNGHWPVEHHFVIRFPRTATSEAV